MVGWQSANFTLPLMVGVALLWRFRDRQLAAAALVACLVSIKPILAPLGLWLIFARGWRAAAMAALFGVVLNAASWTVLGWHEFGAWVALLSHQGGLRDSAGYSLIAMATRLGLAPTMGEALIVVCSCLLIAVAAIAARAVHELCVFGSAVVLTVVISPQSDLHYFAMLLVPLALLRPRLSWEWLAPLLLWACPATQSALWQIALWWALFALLAARVSVLADWGRRDARSARLA